MVYDGGGLNRMSSTIDSRHEAIERVKAYFCEGGASGPDVLAFAPGRVNVIGEHVDYNGGWVLPAAIEYCAAIGLRRRDDGKVRLHSMNMATTVGEFAVTDLAKSATRCWSNYVKGVMAGLTAAGHVLPGFDACLTSDIPIGGGLSSSAALEAVFGLGLLKLIGAEMDLVQLAKLCQKAEHDYAGVPCGLMDQAAVILCREGSLLLLDCETETFEHAPFADPSWGLLVINSGVAHELADGEYAKRRSACHAAARILGVSSLRHVDAGDLDRVLKTPGIDEEMVRCVRHVVTENVRTLGLVQALKDGDYAAAGRLMNASHSSLSVDYRVSCAELDFIAATAQGLPGVAGARMTGGGFGGSAIALVRVDALEAVKDAVREAYKGRYGFEPKIFATRPMSGGAAWLA